MWLVIIEWDGQKPPTTYYNRLHDLGLTVRGTDDKLNSVVARRTGDDPGAIILQEGAVMCPSPSLARTIGLLAQAHGAAFVRLAEIEETMPIAATIEDEAALQRLNKVFGKRGRPSDTYHDFVVTCLEEMRTYWVRESKGVANCPHCHGMRIRSRKGKPHYYEVFEPSDDPFEDWVRLHFGNGLFENYGNVESGLDGVPVEEPPLLADIHITIPKERHAVEVVAASEHFREALGSISPFKAKSAITGAFEAMTYLGQEERSRNRVKAATQVLKMGAEPSRVKLVEAADKVDFLDCVAGLGIHEAASLFMQYEME